MSVGEWLIMGLVVCFIACKLNTTPDQVMLRDIVSGLTCAVVGGGFLSGFIGDAPVRSFNSYSLIVAAIGASVVLWIGHAIAGRRRS